MVFPHSRSLRPLRNRSYRRQNLEGIEFSYCDLRGCDFTAANLRNAQFVGSQTGQSLTQLLDLFVIAFVATILFLLEFATASGGISLVINAITDRLLVKASLSPLLGFCVTYAFLVD